ncbi:MAG: S1C family serine protease [Cytophagaceae bacterium]
MAFSQDMILMRNGNELNVKITDIIGDSVFYKSKSEDKVINRIHSSEVFMVKFQDGAKIVMKKSSSNPPIQGNEIDPYYYYGNPTPKKSEIPYSTIYFVKDFKQLPLNITLPNQQSFLLDYNSVVEYKIYSQGDIAIQSEYRTCNLKVTRGKTYYIKHSMGGLYVVNKEDVREYLNTKSIIKRQETLDFPINRESLKDLDKGIGINQGTCFLISSDGYLITNFHCVDGKNEITVSGINGDFSIRHRATLIASDPSNDLAIIKLNNPNLKFSNPPFSIKTTGINQADKIYAIGFPNVMAMGQEIKITEGIISAKSGAMGDISKYQVSAAINGGNSGGPLIDENGNLIGVIYAKSRTAESAGYAIKASYLESFLKNIDGFNFQIPSNTFKEKNLSGIVSELKNYVFIIESF